jgi:hypothetical protein
MGITDTLKRTPFVLPPTLTGTFAQQFPGLAVSGTDNLAPVPTQDDMDALHGDAAAKVQDLAGQVAADDITPADFNKAMRAVLAPAHADAFALGRQHAGDLDALMGQRAMDAEQEYLDAFEADIAAGRYTDEATGELSEAAISARAALYAAGIIGTAADGFVAAGDEDELYDRVLGIARHCDDCPALADASPYTAETLPQIGTGCACGPNCRCSVVRHSDGAASFTLPG